VAADLEFALAEPAETFSLAFYSQLFGAALKS
jgi:hypothetical protein